MTSLSAPIPTGLRRFRLRLIVVMMGLVCAITALGLYFAQRNLAATVQNELRIEFQSGLDALHGVQDLRHAALAELCRNLVRKPRIHAALEDDALDLLYPIAKDELRDVMTPGDPLPSKQALQGVFYRFLDRKGAVISPPDGLDVGALRPDEEAQLGLRGLPREQQIGYILRKASGALEEMAEVIAMPIVSTDTDEAIAALAIGFKPIEPGNHRAEKGIRSGIWLSGRLHFPSLPQPAQAALGSEVSRVLLTPDRADSSIPVQVDGAAHLLFYTQLNPNSLFPPAYEVSIYPLSALLAQQRQLRQHVAH